MSLPYPSEAVTQMRANQIWQVGRMFLQGLQKEPRSFPACLCRESSSTVRAPWCLQLLPHGQVFEIHALERIFIGEQHTVVERKLSVHLMSQHDVTEFVGEDHGERSFVGQHIQQAAADHDGMPDGERFQRRGEQDTATDIPWISMLLVTIRLLTTVMRILSTSPGGASRPIFCRCSTALSSAWRSHMRSATTGEASAAASLWSFTAEASCGESTRICVNSEFLVSAFKSYPQRRV